MPTMTAGMFIVAVCAFGGLIACAAFFWAAWSGQLADVAEARYLVFDDEDDAELAARAAAGVIRREPPPAP
jgi:nitrogen fixation-related uncharacterized protein